MLLLAGLPGEVQGGGAGHHISHRPEGQHRRTAGHICRISIINDSLCDQLVPVQVTQRYEYAKNDADARRNSPLLQVMVRSKKWPFREKRQKTLKLYCELHLQAHWGNHQSSHQVVEPQGRLPPKQVLF